MAVFDGTKTVTDGLNLLIFRPDNVGRTSRLRYVYLNFFDLLDLDYPQLLGQVWLSAYWGPTATAFSDSGTVAYYGMWNASMEPQVPYSYYPYSPVNQVWFKPKPVAIGQQLYYYVEDQQ